MINSYLHILEFIHIYYHIELKDIYQNTSKDMWIKNKLIYQVIDLLFLYFQRHLGSRYILIDKVMTFN